MHTILSFCSLVIICSFMNTSTFAQKKSVDKKVDSVLKLMTLEEKIGQMNQYNGDWAATGPITNDGDKQTQIKNGMVGSMLNVTGVDHTRTLQQIAMQSRMKIPLLFGQDVIHGYRTIFPIPLAEAASWDLNYIERSERVAAIEASAVGVHWTFAPMVDVARDPRWGRVMEGSGEDTYLGSLIAAARVKGFQGDGLGTDKSIMACAKHFAAYGAAVGGRDYNSVDMSMRQLYETYLPPFKACVDAGAATFMNSFNDLNGIPASASALLQRKILKGEWSFKGFVVSDWGSIGEMIPHGYVKDNYEAAWKASNAGSDMDMESRSYINNLAKLVKDGKVKISVIDDAVRRILRKKFEMGLFDDPYRYCRADVEKAMWNDVSHMHTAREMAKRSIVLLKNEMQGKQVLPLAKNIQSVALIGPFVKAVSDHNGFWSYDWPDDSSRVVTLWDGVKSKVGTTTALRYAKGCDIEGTNKAGFDEALNVARQSDAVVLTLGERRDMSGEAKSRSSLRLPGVQEELAMALIATGKPVIILVHAGRPLVFNDVADNSPAILYTWWLGTQAGNAIADVLFGDYNPAGKLPMTFPITEGQIPIYYNHYNTGRPAGGDKEKNYRSAYTDLSIYPKFAFGYGLSYTTFTYSNLQLDKTKITGTGKIKLTATIKNTGNYDGEEVVQLYIRDLVASVVRPVKELKDFKKIFLKAGEAKTVEFIIDKEKLSFFNDDIKWVVEPGSFDIMIGSSSQDIRLKSSIEFVK